MNRKSLIALARERGLPCRGSRTELMKSLGLVDPIPLLATLPLSPRMPVRVLRRIAAGRGVKGAHSMSRPKLFEALGLPEQESTDISIHKLRLMAKARGLPHSHPIRKEELYGLLGIERPEVIDLRAVRCESIRGSEPVL